MGHCKLQSLGDQTCVKEGGGGEGGETSSAYYAATASNPFPTSGPLPIRGNTPINKRRKASQSNPKSDYTIVDALYVFGSMAMYPLTYPTPTHSLSSSSSILSIPCPSPVVSSNADESNGAARRGGERRRRWEVMMEAL